MKLIKVLIVVFLCVTLFANRRNENVSDTDFVLDTVATVTIQDMNAKKATDIIKASFSLCREYEAMLSRTKKESDIGRLNENKGAPLEVSEETALLLEKSLYYSQLSDGAFDVTIKPLIDIWNIRAENPVVPTREEIANALQFVGYKNVTVKDNQITLHNSAQIDLGGIAKGYIADRMKEYLLAQGCKSGLVNLGGNVLAVGSRADGEPWKVGIQKPFAASGEMVGIVEVVDKSVVTSGSYERYFEKDGSIYHHILDPETGFPAENELSSVTVISDQSVDGDALSTACFVLGLEKGMELLESIHGVEGIFINKELTIRQTSGIGTDIPFQIIQES